MLQIESSNISPQFMAYPENLATPYIARESNQTLECAATRVDDAASHFIDAYEDVLPVGYWYDDQTRTEILFSRDRLGVLSRPIDCPRAITGPVAV